MAPRRIAVGLYHRNNLSEGRMRDIFEHKAYHWGIFVLAGESGRHHWSFEATDASEIDPVTFKLNNPTMDWWFRGQDSIDPERSSKLLGMVIIGEIPDELSFDGMEAIMEAVPLPIRNREPQQSCVTWVGNAIQALQRQGWVPKEIDIDRFKDFALEYGDDRMKREHATKPKTVPYP